MSRMSDIHAAASEIDISDVNAVQELADSIAAERYAAEIYAYAACHSGGYDAAVSRFKPAVIAYADAVRRVIVTLEP